MSSVSYCQFPDPQTETFVHVTGMFSYMFEKDEKMRMVDNRHLLDPVLYKLFEAAGVDATFLGEGAIDHAKKFAQEKKLYEFYEASVPLERQEKYARRSTIHRQEAPPPPPPPPPPSAPAAPSPKVLVKRTAQEDGMGSSNSEAQATPAVTNVLQISRLEIARGRTSLRPMLERQGSVRQVVETITHTLSRIFYCN